MNTSSRLDLDDRFSLASGGRLFEFLRRLDVRQKGMPRVAQRVITLILIVWVPLLLLSLIQGFAFGRQVAEPLLNDLDINIRCLVVVPLLIMAEFTVDPELAGVIKQFINSDLVPPREIPRFESALHATARLRDSSWVEIALMVVALVVSYQAINAGLHDGRSSWLGTISGTTEHMTIAGWWYGLVSGPIQRFLLYRWVWRLLIWCVLLWRISRLDLILRPTHPDRAGGLLFFGYGQVSFTLVILAASAIASAHVGERIIWQSGDLGSYKVLLAGFIALCMVLILGPLVVFNRKLWAAKVRGLQQYGLLGGKYTASFDKKWIRREAEDQPLLGTGDIQSLADLGNSYENICKMKIVPVSRGVVLGVLAAAVAPLLPLLLFHFSVEDLFLKILDMLA